MKRSAALTELSRDHHQALVVAQTMRRARDPREAAASFLTFWREDGQHHFRVEEEVLLPLWHYLGQVDPQAAQRMSSEHLSIRAGALALAAEPSSLERVQALAQQLVDHVRFEERELFPLIEESLGREGLDQLVRTVREAEN